MEIGKCVKSGIVPVPGPPGGCGEDPGLGPPGFPSSGPADATTSLFPVADKPIPKPRQNVHQDVPPPSYADPYAHDPQRPTPPAYNAASVGFQGGDQPSGSTGASGGYEPAGGPQIDPEQMAKAQKMCKFASSSLEYDDVNGAVDYLTKALHLLKTGKEL